MKQLAFSSSNEEYLTLILDFLFIIILQLLNKINTLTKGVY